MIFVAGVTTTWRTVLKVQSIRKVIVTECHICVIGRILGLWRYFENNSMSRAVRPWEWHIMGRGTCKSCRAAWLLLRIARGQAEVAVHREMVCLQKESQ